MRILRFGKSGRLGRVAQRACEAAYAKPEFCTQQRGGGYLLECADAPDSFYPSLDACMRAWRGGPVVVIDASVDHSSTECLLYHEDEKRQAILWLEHEGSLEKIVGFSSGIALLSPQQINPEFTHMLAYRAEKCAQQELFSQIGTPSFLPNLFTLVGPMTYSKQAAAWAQVLKARLSCISQLTLNDPLVRRLWVSEQTVFASLLNFLRAVQPASLAGALVDGVFTLADIAIQPLGADVAPLDYGLGTQRGWLRGDYVVGVEPVNPAPIAPELLRALCY